MGARSDESLRGIDKLREPTVVVVAVVPVRVSQCRRRTIVRRRLGPPERSFSELAEPSTFVRVPLTRRRHEREKTRERNGGVGFKRINRGSAESAQLGF